MFLTISHAATLYYHVHIIRCIADTDYSGITDQTLLNFRDNRAKYLTMWGFFAQAVLFALCLIHDFTRLLDKRHPLRRAVSTVRDLHLTSLAGPLALNVSLMFWTMWAVDRNLVMPEKMDAVIPTWMNHALHTNIVVLVVVELFAERHSLPTLKHSITINILVCATYLYVFLDVYQSQGLWLYPVFDILSWPQRIAFFSAVLVAFIGQLLASRAAVRAIWGDEERGAARGSHISYSKTHKD